MKLLFVLFALFLALCVFGQDIEECERNRVFNVDFWENKFNFVDVVGNGGGRFANLYTSNLTTTQLPEVYPDDISSRAIAGYTALLITPKKVFHFQRRPFENSLTWLGGNTATLYILNEESGDMKVVYIGIGRQTFSYARKRGDMLAVTIRNPRNGRYALIGAIDLPAFVLGDVKPMRKDELMMKYPQHKKVFDVVYR